MAFSAADGDTDRLLTIFPRDRRYSDTLEIPTEGLALRAISRASTNAMISFMGLSCMFSELSASLRISMSAIPFKRTSRIRSSV